MLMPIKAVLLDALRQYRGDNYERAMHAFKGLTPEQMAQEYGQSGFTRQELLDIYRKHVGEVEAARKWVEDHVVEGG